MFYSRGVTIAIVSCISIEMMSRSCPKSKVLISCSDSSISSSSSFNPNYDLLLNVTNYFVRKLNQTVTPVLNVELFVIKLYFKNVT